MLNLIYKINSEFYKKIAVKNILFKKIFYLLYIITSKIINLILPIYYKLTIENYQLEETNYNKEKTIVSLTSFPARINHVWIAIETIFRQSIQPDEIILWLPIDKFNGKKSLPKNLLMQEKKGLTIKFREEMRSHTKYYYAIKEYPDDLIITVDDDIFYPSNTLKNLIELHIKYNDCICCNRGHLITFDSEYKISSYNDWIYNHDIKNEPSKLIMPTGVGGVLYPPRSLDEEVFNKANIKKLCFYADDIWLKFMSLKKGADVVCAKQFPQNLFTVGNTQGITLSEINIEKNKNDEQLQNILNEYFKDGVNTYFEK